MTRGLYHSGKATVSQKLLVLYNNPKIKVGKNSVIEQ